nr:urate oxidase [Paenibacillus sp. UNC451MF]
MNQNAFIELLGWIFEHSPWVAERAWASKPFNSVVHLHEIMVQMVKAASYEERLALLQAHPDLAGRLQMTVVSQQEQRGAGLDQLSEEEYKVMSSMNRDYTERFGFPFIIAVKGLGKEAIIAAMKERLNNSFAAEYERALTEVARIAGFRLETVFNQNDDSGEVEKSMSNERVMYYGKGDVLVYRTYGKPMKGIRPIPESDFTGEENVIFAHNIKIAVRGEPFLSSFTEGDNSMVVATDSMKNFILRHAADYKGNTTEGFLEFVSRRFLDAYPQMTSIEITGDRIPFLGLQIPGEQGLKASGLVYRYSHNDHPTATLEVKRSDGVAVITRHRCGLADLQLIKVRGSGFAGFVRDEYTTLPETNDRPLFIYLDIHWTYSDPGDSLSTESGRYVPAEHIRDIAHVVFHEKNSPSIQHLIYHIGLRMMERFPQIESVQFESNNRTWETVVETVPDSEGRVYTEPRPPYGFQGFSMTREDLARIGG